MDATTGNKQEDVKKIASRIGKELKAIIIYKDKQQQHVAEAYGTTKNAFNNLINKKINKISDILNICNVLDCDVKLTFTDKKTGKVWECDFKE